MFNEIENQCKSTSKQNNVLNIIGSNVSKLSTKQLNRAKSLCVLQTAIKNVTDTASQNSLLTALSNTLGVSAETANKNATVQDVASKNEAISKATQESFMSIEPFSVMEKFGLVGDVSVNKSEQNTQISNTTLNSSTNVNVSDTTTNATTSNDNTNIVRQQLSQETVNQAISGCITDIEQSNIINIIGSNVSDSELNQENDYIANCLSKYGVDTKSESNAGVVIETENANKSDQKAVDTNANTSEQKNTADNTASSTVEQTAGGISWWWIIIICISCCIPSIISSVMAAMGAASGQFGDLGGMSKGLGSGMNNMSSNVRSSFSNVKLPSTFSKGFGKDF